MYSDWPWRYRPFLAATFRTGPRPTTAAILAGPFRRRCRATAARLGLFVFLVIVPVYAAATFCPLLGLGTDRFASLLRRGFFGRRTRRTGCGLALGRATFSSAARRRRRTRR